MAGAASFRPAAAARGAALLAAVAVLAAPCAAAAAGPATPSVAPCALGILEPAARTAIPAALAREEARFAGGLRGLSSARRRAARRALGTAVAAYVYGLAPVAFNRTIQRFPGNSIVSIAQLAGPATRAVVAPNHDTLYLVAQINLIDGPLVIDLPDAGQRYAVLALLDAFTNDFAYLDARSAAGGARSVAITPPGWQGTLPAGVRRVASPTGLVWLLGRTLIDGDDDLPGARGVLAGYALTSLAGWIRGERRRALVLDAFPGDTQAALRLPLHAAWAIEVGTLLAAAPARDACALRAFATLGIGPRRSPASDPVIRAAVAAAQRIALRIVRRALDLEERASRRRNRGWLVASDRLGRYGRGYLYRAGVALDGLGANTRREADYPRATLDADGRPLTGAHRYVLRFAPGELPPVRAFWSLTLYDRRSFLVENPIDRYAIGDRTRGLRRGADGSLTLYVQRTAPSGVRRANWLPAPAGRFRLTMRLYEPQAAALTGRWKPPAIRRGG